MIQLTVKADTAVQEANYVGSWSRYEDCPQDGKPCYAFIGRSNVGKSSLINMLTGRVKLAHVSKAPGKTQSINYFDVDREWYIVDLPGYGYAKRSKKMRAAWERMIEKYLVLTRSLICTFVLLDGRHELQQIDREFIDWLGERQLPFVIVYTKLDKVKPAEIDDHIQRIQSALLEDWEELPQQFRTSSIDKSGRSEILDFIDLQNQNYQKYLEA